MHYKNTLKRIKNGLSILANYPDYVQPLECENRYLAPQLINDKNGKLLVRSWRYWYNARGIVEMESRLEAKATAIIMVHPWGMDDGSGLKTPEPAGCAFFCTQEKNRFVASHIRDVINPFFRRLRNDVAVIAYSLPGKEDDVRKQIYPSILTRTEKVNVECGKQILSKLLKGHKFKGAPLIKKLKLDPTLTLKSYFDKTPSTDASMSYNGRGFWDLPMPIMQVLERGSRDIIIYDAEGYPKVRDYLKQVGVRHILLTGYSTDMCVARSTCGYDNFSRDFNMFLVGDATLATYPGSATPKYATQVALANAALHQMITQVDWILNKSR